MNETTGEIARKSKFNGQLRTKLKKFRTNGQSVIGAPSLGTEINQNQESIWKKLKVWWLIGVKLNKIETKNQFEKNV